MNPMDWHNTFNAPQLWLFTWAVATGGAMLSELLQQWWNRRRMNRRISGLRPLSNGRRSR